MGLLNDLRNSVGTLNLPEDPALPEGPATPFSPYKAAADQMALDQLLEAQTQTRAQVDTERQRQDMGWKLVSDNLTPETAAKIRALSENQGIPLYDASQQFANELIKDADFSVIRQTLSENHGIYAALTENLLSAPELFNDAEGLSVAELAFRALKLRSERLSEERPVDIVSQFASSVVGTAWGSVEGGVELLSALERRSNVAQEQGNWVVAWMDKLGLDTSGAVDQPDPLELSQYMRTATELVAPHADALEEYLAPEHRTFTTDVAGAFGSFTALALTFYVGGSIAATLGMLGLGADQQMQLIEEARGRLDEANYDPETRSAIEDGITGVKADGTEFTAEEDWALITAALTEATIEKIAGVEFILKALPNRVRSTLLRVLLSSGAEGATEALQSISQRFIASETYDPDIDITEGAAYEALLGAIVGGGVSLVTGGAAPTPPSELANREARLADIDSQIEALHTARLAVEESKTFQMDPLAVRAVLEKSGDQVVSMPAEEVSALYQEGFISQGDLEALQISDNLQQMVDISADIEVPASVLLTLPESDFAQISRHVRVSPEKPTQAEAQASLAALDEDVKRMTAELQATLQTDLAGVDAVIRIQEEAKTVAPVIETQLIEQLGMPKEEAAPQAALIAQRYAVRSDAMENVTALQLLEQDRLEFQRGQAPVRPQVEQQEAVTASPEFQAWFGDSKIVDDAGKPLLVYHGTPRDEFTAFDPSAVGTERDAGFYGEGFYFSPSEDIAEGYAETEDGEFGRVMPAYLSLQNPYVLDLSAWPETRQALVDMGIRSAMRTESDPSSGLRYTLQNTEPAQFSALLREVGHDGIVVRDDNGVMEVVVFSPEQIKSPFNVGTFDPTSPSILEQPAAEFQVNPLPVEGTGPNGKVKKQDLARVWTDRHMSLYGRKLDPSTDAGDYAQVLDHMLVEYAEQLTQHDDGLGWYTADIARALEVTQQIIPEITDPARRDLFITLAAVTSPRERPNTNWEKAIDAMQQYLQDGVMPLRKQNGKQFGVSSVTSNIQLLGQLIERFGEQGAVDWLTSMHTGAEMAEIRRDSGQFVEGKPLAYYTPNEMNLKSEAMGVYMFGPKVGDFFLNASGVDQEAVTVDMWLAQTYNRHVGRLLDIGKAALEAGGVATEVRTKTERDTIKSLIRDVASRNGVEASAAQAALWYFEQRLERSHGLVSPSQSFSGAAENAAHKRGIEVQPRAAAPDGRSLPDAAATPILEQLGRGEVDEQTLYERGIAPSDAQIRREVPDRGRAEADDAAAEDGRSNDPVTGEDLVRIQDDPEFLEEFLTRPNWGVVTATQALPDTEFYRKQREERPKLYELSLKQQAEQNAREEDLLRSMLEDSGTPYIEMVGVYKGEPDGTSFMIVADESAVIKLGKRFNQDSILTRDGLIFTTRPQPDVRPTGEVLTGEQATQEEFFSVLPSGSEFSMGLDFATTGAGVSVLPEGYTELASRPQLPVRPDGFVELFHWSDKQLTSVDPAFAGTGPLKGEERKRGAKLSYFGINPRANARTQGTGYVKEAGLGPVQHVAFIRPDELYPWFEDPDNLVRSSKDVSEAEQKIKAAGYRGFYTTDDGSGRAPQGNAAAMFDATDVVNVPVPLEQGPRGAYVAPTLNERTNLIWLSDQADLSTFLHETGHMFLFQLVADANDARLKKDAKRQYGQMMDGVRSWFGQNADQAKKDLTRLRTDLKKRIKDEEGNRRLMLENRLAALDRVADKAKADKGYLKAAGEAFMAPTMAGYDADAEVLFHELWARGFERYLAEGKAPTKSLKRAFQKFSSWLINVYRQLANLNVSLSPEIRDVFDRLLTSEEALAQEINTASQKIPSEILQFATATEARKLAQLVDDAELEARAQMQQRQARAFQQEERDARKAKREELTEKYTDEVRQEPIYAATRIAREGIMPDGQEIGNKPMDKAEVDALIGRVRAEALPAGVATKGDKKGAAIPASDVATLAGFESAEDMLQALTERHMPEDQEIARRVDEQMRAEMGDEATQATLAEDAAASVQNDKFAELQALQVRILRRMAQGEVEKVARREVETEGAPSVAKDREAQAEAAALTGPEAALAKVKADVQRRVNIGHRRAQQAGKRAVRAIRRGIDPRAINAAADAFVSQMEVGKATPARYRQAANRLSAKIERAIAGREYNEAANMMEQRALLLAVSKRVAEFQSKSQRKLKSLREFTGRSDKKLAKGYDIDFVNAIRAALSPFDMAKSQPLDYDADAALKSLQTTEPELYEEVTRTIEVWTARGQGMTGTDRYKNLTVAEFTDAVELADMLKAQARAAAGVLVEGRRINHAQIAMEINRNADNMRGVEKREARKPKFRGSEWQRWLTEKRNSVRGSLRIVGSWVRMADRDNVAGPLTTSLLRPIMEATTAYYDNRTKPQELLLDVVLGRADLAAKKPIEAPELDGWIFQSKGELIHFLLHMGNESNKSKLLRGGAVDIATGQRYIWGSKNEDGTVDTTRADMFLQRMYDEGVITKEDIELVQGIWDIFEATKPAAQAAHKRMYGYNFDEVEATPFVTPFGTYAGGYVPAIYDPMMSDAAARREAEMISSSSTNTFMFPTVERGFTKSRVEGYADPLKLDLVSIPAHFDRVMKFAYLAPTVQDAARLVTNTEVAAAINRISPAYVQQGIIPWLQTVASQQVTTPSKKGDWISSAFTTISRRVGLHLMMGNVVNASEQVSGFAPAVVRVGAGNLAKAMTRWRVNEQSARKYVISRSQDMEQRLLNSTNEAMHTTIDILSDKGKLSKMEQFSAKYGYFLQQMVQNVMDPIVWLAAEQKAMTTVYPEIYQKELSLSGDEALATEKADAAVVFFADQVVRETQASMRAGDIANINVGSGSKRLFLKFFQWFSAMGNLMGTEVQIAWNKTNIGWGHKMGRSFYVYLMVFATPMIVSEALRMALSGELDDIDDEDDMLAVTTELLVGSQVKGALAMVPYVGQAAGAAYGVFTKEVYDNRINVGAPIGMVERTFSGVFRLIYAAIDPDTDIDTRQSIRSMLDLIALTWGLPTNAFSKPISYAIKVQEGEADPEGLVDVLQGAITGRDGTE